MKFLAQRTYEQLRVTVSALEIQDVVLFNLDRPSFFFWQDANERVFGANKFFCYI